MGTETSTAYQLGPVQFSRLTRRGILLGLSLPQLIALSIAVLTIVVSLYTAGAAGIAWTSPIWATAAAVAAIPIGGRKVVEWVPIVSRWLWRAAYGQLTYRRRIVKPRPAGTLALPGDAAPLREWNDPESGAVMGPRPAHADPHRDRDGVASGVRAPRSRRAASSCRRLGPCARRRLPIRAYCATPGH